MYELVDAVNQQMPLSIEPSELLILTKFAELVRNPYKPVMRVGVKRFTTITHIKKKTLTKYLDNLEELGYLVPSTPGEARRQKHKGDMPCEYYLHLPEGFDKAIVDSRRAIYYGGKKYNPEEGEELSVADFKEGDLLPEVDNRQMANSSAQMANSSAQTAKFAPINNQIKEDDKVDEKLMEIFNNIASRTGEDVLTVRTRYFSLIISPLMADVVEVAFKASEKAREKKRKANPPEEITHWADYVQRVIEQKLKNWKAPLEPNHDAPQSAPKTALNQYELLAEKTKAEIKKQAEDAQKVENIQAENDRKQQEYFAKKMPEVAKWPSVSELPEDERTAYLKAFKTMFSARWDYDDFITAFETELKAAGNVKIIDFTRDFASKSGKLVFDFPDPA